MHSLACVPNDTLKVRVEGIPPRGEPAHAPEISWKQSAERLIGDLLSASLSWKQSAEPFIGDLLSAFILFSAKRISLLLPGRRSSP